MYGNYYVPFSLRVPDDLLYKVKFIAKVHSRSANKEMEFILKQYIAQFERKFGPVDLPDDLVKPDHSANE